jgi:hypothetical protein
LELTYIYERINIVYQFDTLSFLKNKYKLLSDLIRIFRLKKLKTKYFKNNAIHHSLLFFAILSVTACFQTNLLENQSVPSGKHTVVVMPEQTCADEENGRKLFDEKILHPSHKECYYK